MGVAMGPNLVRMMAREASATERKTTAGLRHLQPVSHLEPTTLVSTYRYPIQSLAPTYPFRNQISPKYEGLQTERAAEDSPQIERKLESRSTKCYRACCTSASTPMRTSLLCSAVRENGALPDLRRGAWPQRGAMALCF